MPRPKCILTLWFSAAVLIPIPCAKAQQVIQQSVFGNGGNAIGDSLHSMVGTTGQTLIGIASSSSRISKVGFWYQSGGLVTTVERISDAAPKNYRLQQNYPNPFNATTTIAFFLPRKTRVSLKLFDLLGRELTNLLDEKLEPGEYRVRFDASGLPSGVYVYRLRAEGFVENRKLLLLK